MCPVAQLTRLQRPRKAFAAFGALPTAIIPSAAFHHPSLSGRLEATPGLGTDTPNPDLFARSLTREGMQQLECFERRGSNDDGNDDDGDDGDDGTSMRLKSIASVYGAGAHDRALACVFVCW